MPNLLKILQQKDPERFVLFTAVNSLRTPEEIRQFYQEYIFWAWCHDKSLPVEEVEEIANRNIGYIVVYDSSAHEAWKTALPQITSPIDTLSDQRVKEYAIIFKSDDDTITTEIVEYIREKLTKPGSIYEDPLFPSLDGVLNGFSGQGCNVAIGQPPIFSMVLEHDKSGKPYMAARLTLEEMGNISADQNTGYIWILAHINILSTLIESRYGRQPTIFVERTY